MIWRLHRSCVINASPGYTLVANERDQDKILIPVSYLSKRAIFDLKIALFSFHFEADLRLREIDL